MIDGRRLMMASRGGSGAQVVTGTFTGDGTISVSLSIGFAPDIAVISSDQDYSQSGWAGVGDIVIIKGDISFLGRHNATSATAIRAEGNPSMDGAYGSSSTAPTYAAYGTYSDGALTVTNKNNATGTVFVNGVTYSWVAVKYTTD